VGFDLNLQKFYLFQLNLLMLVISICVINLKPFYIISENNIECKKNKTEEFVISDTRLNIQHHAPNIEIENDFFLVSNFNAYATKYFG